MSRRSFWKSLFSFEKINNFLYYLLDYIIYSYFQWKRWHVTFVHQINWIFAQHFILRIKFFHPNFVLQILNHALPESKVISFFSPFHFRKYPRIQNSIDKANKSCTFFVHCLSLSVKAIDIAFRLSAWVSKISTSKKKSFYCFRWRHNSGLFAGSNRRIRRLYWHLHLW